MQFGEPLVRGTLVRRYKRFLADVALHSGEPITAHCPNPGAMTGLAEPGMEVWLSRSHNPKRKLAYSWEMVRVGGSLVGINAGQANRIAEEAIRRGAVAELMGYPQVRREVRYGRNSRIDLLLEGPGRPPCYVEVKNVHLARTPGLAEFPDSVTARGAKHMFELSRVAAQGMRAVVFYVVQRSDGERFSLAADIDPAYTAAWRAAASAGVETTCYACTLSLREIVLDKALPVHL